MLVSFGEAVGVDGTGVGVEVGGTGVAVGGTDVDVAVGGIGVAVDGTGAGVFVGNSGGATGALHPTINSITNITPMAGSNNLLQFISPSFRGSHRLSRPLARGSAAARVRETALATRPPESGWSRRFAHAITRSGTALIMWPSTSSATTPGIQI